MTPSTRPSFASQRHGGRGVIGGELLLGNRRARSAQRLRVPDEAGIRMRLEIPRRADDEAVEVVRIALCLDQPLASAVRARAEIRVARRLAVVRRDHASWRRRRRDAWPDRDNRPGASPDGRSAHHASPDCGRCRWMRGGVAAPQDLVHARRRGRYARSWACPANPPSPVDRNLLFHGPAAAATPRRGCLDRRWAC